MRYSKQREIIKIGLLKFCIHPTAEELYMKLKPDNLNLSLSTVYRNLKQLADAGEIKRIEGLSEQTHYDHNTSEHFHIICEKCKKVFDLPAEMADSLKRVLENQNDFEIQSYDIIVKCICQDCKRATE